MNSEQIIAYIAQHIQQGHSEIAIREHLASNRWPQALIDQSFALYHAAFSGPVMQQFVMPATPHALSVQTPSKKSRRKWLFAIPVLIIFMAVVAVSVLASPKMENKLAQPALAQHAQNTARENDAQMLISAISQYMSANSGNLPQTLAKNDATTLAICGTNCDATSVKATLNHYQPSAVSIKTYASSLKIPDAETMYVVMSAICNQQNNGLIGASDRSAVAILYGVSSHSATEQKCAGL